MPQVPKLQIPDCAETKAFRAVCSVLKNDPTVRRVFRKVITWEGVPDDSDPPVVSNMPFLELQPAPNATGWTSESEHFSDMTILITLAANGTNADDMLNLWGVVRSALFVDPADSRQAQIKALMNSVGVINGTLISQPFQCFSPDADTQILVGEGSLKLRINVNT